MFQGRELRTFKSFFLGWNSNFSNSIGTETRGTMVRAADKGWGGRLLNSWVHSGIPLLAPNS